MDREQLIQSILKITPKEIDNGKAVQALRYDPLVEKFGQIILGIGDYWSWFTRTNPGFPAELRNKDHSFLEDATDEELGELLSVLKNKEV